MTRYRLRAECPIDVEWLAYVLGRAGIPVADWRVTRDPDYPDVGLTVASDAAMEAIRRAIAAVDDSHVMQRNLAPETDCTGSGPTRAPHPN